MNKWVKKISVFSLATLMGAMVAACNANNDGNATTQSLRQGNIYDNKGAKMVPGSNVNKYPNGTYPFNESNARTHGITNMDRNVANRMARIAADINGVTKATAVVQGKDAIVGIDVEQGKNRSTVENNVLTAIRTGDPAYRVHVTSNADLNRRIRVLNEQVRSGQHTRTVGQDFGILVRDIGRTISAPFRR
jgi:YhcN/YlaJ family sporulation lipoprotein